MPYEELGEIAELGDGKVGGQRCLSAFLSNNSDAYERKKDTRQRRRQIGKSEERAYQRPQLGSLTHRFLHHQYSRHAF